MKLILLLTMCSFNLSGPLPEDLVKQLEHNILAYAMVNYGYLGVDKFGNLETKEPLFEKFFLDETKSLNLNFQESSNIEYPVDGYRVFIVSNPKRSILVNDSIIVTNAFPLPNTNRNSEDYLIAFNDTSSDLKFLSGELYRSIIGPDFGEGKQAAEEVLRIKYYHYDLTKIKFKRERNGYYLFRAYSEVRNEKLKFKVDVDYLDYIEIVKQR